MVQEVDLFREAVSIGIFIEDDAKSKQVAWAMFDAMCGLGFPSKLVADEFAKISFEILSDE